MNVIEELSPSTAESELRKLDGSHSNGDGGKTKRRNFTATLVFLSHLFLVRLEKGLENTGLFFSRKQLQVVFLSLLILATLCLGFLRTGTKKIPPRIYENEQSQGRQDFVEASKAFPTLDSWKVTILVSSKSGGNVLNSDCLDEAGRVHNSVTNASWFKKRCVLDNSGSCATSTPLILRGLKRKDLKILNSNEQNKTFIQLNEALKLYNVSLTTNISANSLSMSYFLKKPENKKERNELKDFWSNQQTSLLRKIESSFLCASFHVLDTNIYDDNVWTALHFQRLPLFYALPFLIFLCFILIALQLNCFLSLLTTSLLIVCIFLSSISTFAMCNMFGISFQEIYIVVPCFVICKAFTDALLLLRALIKVSNLPSHGRRISSCMTSAGLVVTLTSLLSCILFVFPIWSSFEGVSHFFVLALVSIILAYLTILTLFLTVLFWVTNRNQRKLVPSQSRSTNGKKIKFCRKIKLLVKYWVRFLTSVPGKILLGFFIVVLLTLCTFVLATRKVKLQTIGNIFKTPTKIEKAANGFPTTLEEDVTIFFPKGLNYSSQNTRSSLIDFLNEIKSFHNSKITSANWIESFEMWKNKNGKTCPANLFYECLSNFLKNNITSLFEGDLQLKRQGNISHIQTSRVRISVTLSSDISKDISVIELLQIKIQNSKFIKNAKFLSANILALEDFETFISETLFAFLFLTIALIICLFPFTSSMRTPLVLLLTFLMLTIEALTVMCLLDIPLNQLSFICLYPVLVFSFGASIYVSETYIISKKDTIKGRITDAIDSNFSLLITGLILGILMSVALGFSFPSISIILLQAIPITVLLGTVHAFIFLPCILSTYGKSRNFDGRSLFPMSSFIVKGFNRKRLETTCFVNRNETAELPKLPSVSVIGISCRFPQASSKDEFWDMLKNGRCCVSSFPENRPEEFKNFKDNYHPKRFVPGRLCTLDGGYLDNIRKFDAGFFGTSPQEASSMDPQQRILLQVAFEAIEDAGMKLEDLQASCTGVFVGLMNRDFGDLMSEKSNLRNMDQFASTGTSSSIVSNRISFYFNLNGPSFTVDTACSSSLTAFKLAVDSLRNGDCEVALVCAPNIILSYKLHMTTSMAGLLAPDGRCKSFDSSGDGYGRGEGFAAVVLKLSDTAIKDEDDIYCEVVACGLNNDGANAFPITAPSSRSQADLFKTVLKRSGLQANDIDYIEAHGTGTAIGDVVEITSIAEAYGIKSNDDTKRTLRIGSVKSNLNHTESTSGLAGLIKLALMIKHGSFVPTINIQQLNPKLKLTEKGLIVQQSFESWKRRRGKARIGAVNSYGFGGSNVHVILREVTRPIISKSSKLTRYYCNGTNIITLSARSLGALKESARLHSQWLLNDEAVAARPRDVCFSLNERRTVHLHRLAIAFKSTEEVVSSLNAFHNDTPGWQKMVSSGKSNSGSQKLLFMFGGQGAQWYAMGRQLIEKERVVSETIIEIDNLLKEFGEDWNLKEELSASQENSKIDQLVIGQIATFSIQLAIARLLISWGIYPAAVVGHSLGEFAAACVAGSLTLKETLSIVLLRAKLQLKCPEDGAMAALGMSSEEAQGLIADLKLDKHVEIAAYNDAKSVTISGDMMSVECISEYLTVNNIQVFWRILNTSRAFHSYLMANIENPFKLTAQKKHLKPREVAIAFYSTVEGDNVSGRKLDYSYWWRNIRNPVKFHQAMKSALSDGYTKIVEISAQPTLAHYIKQITSQEGITDEKKPVVIPTLPKKTVEEHHKVFIQNTICTLYSLDYPIQWPRIRGEGSCSFVRPPTYPWQEKEYWYRSYVHNEYVIPLKTDSKTDGQLSPSSNHPFLGEVTNTQQFNGLSCWSTEIDLQRFSFLKDHALTQGGAIMPGAAYIEMAFAMAKEKFLCSAIELHDVRLWSLLTLPESQVRHLRLRLTQSRRLDEATFEITSVQENQTELLLSSGWVSCDVIKEKRNAAITLKPTGDHEIFSPNIKAIQKRMIEMPLQEFKDLTSSYGFSYGPHFSVIQKVWKGENEGLCLVSVSNIDFFDQALTTELAKYVVHPSVLDACFQSCIVPISGSALSETSVVPVGFKRIQLVERLVEGNMVCHVTMDAERFGYFDVTLMSLRGKAILKIKDFQVAELTGLKQNAQPQLEEIIYEMQWIELSTDNLLQPLNYSDTICVVLKDSKQLCNLFIASLKKQGVEVMETEFPISRDFLENQEKDIKETVEFAIQRSVSHTKKLKLVSFWPAEADLFPEDVNSINQAQNIAFRSSVFLIKQIANSVSDMIKGVQIVFITQGNFFLKKTDEISTHPMPWSSTVWGLRRTAALENINMEIKAVDLSLDTSQEEINLLVQHLGSTNVEEELAFRGSQVFANRIVRPSSDILSGTSTFTSNNLSEANNFFLEQNPSTLGIFLREETQSTKNKDEAVVQTLNLFSTENKILSIAKGIEDIFSFSGNVIQSNSKFKAGDEVFGLIKQPRIGNCMTIEETHLIPKPQELNLKESAYIPLCLVIAMEVVQKVTLKNKSMKILIHEADKILGFASAIILKMKGHRVFCTANKESNETGNDFLLENELDVIADVSCIGLSEKYYDYFDVVIYLSVPQPGSLQHSFRSLQSNGRLLLISKNFSGAIVLPEHKCINYERIQVSDLLESPATFSRLWGKCYNLTLVSEVIKCLQNLPHNNMNLFEAMEKWNDGCMDEDIERFVSRSFNFGSTSKQNVVLTGIDHFGMKGNRSYIVAGGVRGYGFEVARWMCENGANTVILLARSRPSQDKLQQVAELQRKTGSNILILAVDISREDHMISLENKLQDLPSVAGIVLTAMVLKDSLISLMDINSFRDVMAPKVTGGYLLHKLSLKMDLDFFILFSSMSSIVGNVGQASYSAANAYLDALASYRRHFLGLPALSINWGPIGGAGIMARENNIAKLLTRAGLDLISATEGPNYMAKISCYQPSKTQIGIFIADWPVFLKSNQHLSRTSRLELLRNDSQASEQNDTASSLASRILLEKNATKRANMTEEFINSMFISWVGLESLSEVDINTSLYSYGVDSTAALTLKMQLESSLQISFEIFYFMQPDTTPSKIAQDVIKRLNGPLKDTDQKQIGTIPQEIEDVNEQAQETTNNDNHQIIKSSCQVIPLYKPEKAEIKYFCIHPSHRFAMSLASIAVGFQIQDLVSFYAIGYTEPTEQGDWSSVRELAREYLDLIRKEQRHGPYFIGGYSYGGLVAYEIACLLMECEEQVEFLGMIDTFPWLPPSRGGYSRLVSWFHSEFSPRKQVELQYEAYLEKLALQNLKMTKQEYDEMKLQQTTKDVIKELQQRSQQLKVPIYNLEALWESLLNDHVIASNTQEAWEPAATQYNGYVTYLKCEDRRFSPKLPLMSSPHKAWNEVLPGPMDVIVCPGDHFSLSELPFARVTGRILVTAVGIKYRSLFPELYHFDMTYKQRNAIKQLKNGVEAMLYSKKDRKAPRLGKILLDEEKNILRFLRGQDRPSKFNGKTVQLKELRCILPGRYVRNAIRAVSKANKLVKSNRGQKRNLYNVVSLFGEKRIFNIEFLSFDTLKEFYQVIEAIHNVKMEFF